MINNPQASNLTALPQQSLIVKVGRIITGFSFVIVVFYSYMLLVLKDSGLRDATHSVLLYETFLYHRAHGIDKTALPPNAGSLKGFIGEHNLPKEITKVFPIEKRNKWFKRKSGIYYRFTSGNTYISHHHMHVTKLPTTGEEFFLYYRLNMDKSHDIWGNVKQVALLGFVLVVTLLLILRKFINRAMNPLLILSNWIGQLKENKEPPPLPSDIKEDEIGQLAHNLYNALKRINNHNEKERLFLRNASHELRTPIAIIRNTMDVIEHKQANSPDTAGTQRLLARIRRASDTMKSVTEAILWLALDDYHEPSASETDMKTMLKEVVEENQNLIQEKNVQIHLEIDKLGSTRVEPALLHIALDNLIRNAFQHCNEGEIKIIAESENHILISNRRYDLEENRDKEKNTTVRTGGFGLGLALVQNIAEKKHWHFRFGVHNDYATAELKL